MNKMYVGVLLVEALVIAELLAFDRAVG